MNKNYNKPPKNNKNNDLSTPLNSPEDNSFSGDDNGSYTGNPADGGIPVQDADDL